MIQQSSSEQELINESLREIEFPRVLAKIAGMALSPLGREIILALQPIEDTLWLRAEHERVGELRDLLVRNENFPVEGIADIRPQLQKSQIAGSFLSPSELLNVYETIRASRLLAAYFRSKKEIAPAMADFALAFYENRFLEKHITDAIDDTGLIRDNASRELASVRRDIQETSSKLRGRLNKILARVAEEDLVTDEYITQREGRFVLPMKATNKRSLPGIIHGMSNTGATVFVEPAEIVEVNNHLSLLLSEERREMIRILTTLTAELGAEARQFMQSMEVLAHFDAMFAKARYALEQNGMKPVITDDKEISLRNCYHPLLQPREGQKPVPLSVDFSEQTRGHLISGPNAGGKTVALKSIGLNIAMALSGIFPLGECRTGPHTVFCAIGDHQSIENNLSTFSSQIVRLREILSYCSPLALILVDEICSGTDPQEGGALAAGIIDSFIERKALFVVTTHQSSLKSYALNRPEILNASMEFDSGNLIPTYRFQSGIPGNSYAFVLARTVGIPEIVMDRAQTYLGDRHSELEQSIAALQAYKVQAEQAYQEAARQQVKAEQFRAEFEEKNAELKKKKNELMQKAREQANEIVQKASAVVEKTVKEIREQSRDIGDVRREFDQIRKEIEQKTRRQEEEKKTVPAGGFSIGDAVYMADNQRDMGTVISVDEAGNSAIVEFNGLKFRTALPNLRPAGKAKPKENIRSSGGGFVKFDTRTSVDLRGFRADEACKDVEKLLSDAMMTNLNTVTIIHGKGTGALRQAIHEQLRYHPGVESFRNGTIAEGGDGVTVVELK
jgi:DNA mismatch repair protein MutS2